MDSYVQKFERRTKTIDAMQHDGTDESAVRIERWVAGHGGKVEMFRSGTIEYDLDSAFLRIDNARAQNLVIPGSWVISPSEGLFYPVSAEDFDILYKEISSDRGY